MIGESVHQWCAADLPIIAAVRWMEKPGKSTHLVSAPPKLVDARFTPQGRAAT
jgi:hypothetical protein